MTAAFINILKQWVWYSGFDQLKRPKESALIAWLLGVTPPQRWCSCQAHITDHGVKLQIILGAKERKTGTKCWRLWAWAPVATASGLQLRGQPQRARTRSKVLTLHRTSIFLTPASTSLNKVFEQTHVLNILNRSSIFLLVSLKQTVLSLLCKKLLSCNTVGSGIYEE